MKPVCLLPLFSLACCGYASAQPQCPSEATLIIQSAGYSGPIDIELRQGTRPGSSLVRRNRVNTSGTVVFRDVCPGTYFYAFANPDSPQVSTTQYFQIVNDGYQYSMPTITVTYTRSSSGNRVGSAKRADL
jgi:hypothetical protein